MPVVAAAVFTKPEQLQVQAVLEVEAMLDLLIAAMVVLVQLIQVGEAEAEVGLILLQTQVVALEARALL